MRWQRCHAGDSHKMESLPRHRAAPVEQLGKNYAREFRQGLVPGTFCWGPQVEAAKLPPVSAMWAPEIRRRLARQAPCTITPQVLKSTPLSVPRASLMAASLPVHPAGRGRVQVPPQARRRRRVSWHAKYARMCMLRICYTPHSRRCASGSKHKAWKRRSVDLHATRPMALWSAACPRGPGWQWRRRRVRRKAGEMGPRRCSRAL
jgi:hypothetical protein